MESQHTLVHTPPSWDPSPPQTPARGRIGASRRDAPAAEATTQTETVVLGRYRLLERLGRGGFGEVWRAHDELLHREVALKQIWLGPHGDSERATREALAAARLAHPAIVALYEAAAVDESFYLISELVDGETLARLIDEEALSDEEVLEIGVALAGALAHAHARGVIHRDIKPQNVLIPDHPEGAEALAKLTDFGGASLVGEDNLTRTGDVLGTLAYMAPEQSEGREVGQPADLYALALVLYEALCGVNPVRGRTPAATARRIGRALAPLERARSDLPRGLTRAIDTALSLAPAERGTLDELRGALEEALERGLGRSWRRPAPVRARPQPAPRPPADCAPEPRAAVHTALQPRGGPRARVEPIGQGTEGPAAPSRLLVPRGIWIVCALALIVWELWRGRGGVALLVLAAALPLLAAPRRAAPVWLLAALAPVLGLAGLAGAYPAIAGQARRWRARMALGALGYWWLTLAEPLLGRRLWLGAPAGTPARAVWESSLAETATHVVGPALGLGVLLGAALWAGAALLLPWVVRGRSAVADLIGAAAWSAAIVLATPALDAGLSPQAAHAAPRGALAGALLGCIIAVAARALRGPV